MIINRGIMIRVSTRSYSSIHPECSLDQLASTIEKYYYGLSDIFSDLTVSRMRDIQNQIRTGKYTLTSLQLIVNKNLDSLKGSPYIINMSIDNQKVYGCLTPILEDKLVLIALAAMLNTRIHEWNIQHPSCFSFKESPTDYYTRIRSREGPISRVYKLDMLNSLYLINRNTLLSKLKPIVSNDEIMQFLHSFLYIQILYEGQDLSYDLFPTSELITEVLLDFYLKELDNQFHLVFPCFSYTRYVNEILITTPHQVPFFESSLFALLESLELDGRIVSIGPGDPPIPCHEGALISLTEDGRLFIDKSTY